MKEFDLESLNHFIANGHAQGCEYEIIKTGFEILPNDFLKFADCDLIAEYEHHLVNSLSNSKRAIDSQLDSLLIGLGLSERAKKWNFPTKIDYLNSIGIISPKVLNKINKKRNLLEHKYKNPNKEEVEDALDVATLFINYTNKYLSPALIECALLGRELQDEAMQCVTVKLDWQNYKLIFKGADEDLIAETYEPIVKELTADQTDYDEYLKFYLNLYNIMNH